MKKADLAILGLIVEKPRYGYEIEQVIEARNMRDWTEIGFSSIYNILGRLQKKGYVTATLVDRAGRGPARKVYEVTGDGRSAWYDATINALSTPAGDSQPFYLGLVGLPEIPREEALKALDRYQENLQQRRDQVNGRWLAVKDQSFYVVDAMFDYGLHMIDAEIEWIQEFRKQLAGTSKRHSAGSASP